MLALLFLLIGLGIPAVLAWSFGRFKEAWPKWKVVLWSAMPIPALVAIPSGFVILHAMTTSAEDCGVDACGMAMAAGLAMLGMAGALLLVGALFAAAVVAFVRRSVAPKADVDIFG